MLSWECGYPDCGWIERHPTKYPVMVHIEEEHLGQLQAAAYRCAQWKEDHQKPDEDSLIRASLSRSEKDPNMDLGGMAIEPVGVKMSRHELRLNFHP